MLLIEAIAVFFGLLCVTLTIRQNIWCWPAGLVQVALFIVIFWQAKLYLNLALHVLYVFLQIYGWYHWLHGGKNRNALPVSVLDVRARLALPVLATLATLGGGYLMLSLTDASAPYGDAFITASSLIAQWLMVRKKVESWLFWVAVDIVAIAIYWQQSLYLTSGLYTVFLVLACLGWHTWRSSYQNLQVKQP